MNARCDPRRVAARTVDTAITGVVTLTAASNDSVADDAYSARKARWRRIGNESVPNIVIVMTE